MELAFTISGDRPGFEYDIVRTRRNALWERRRGVWARLGANPMGTRDDHHDGDECLKPSNANGQRIFAVDTPGWVNIQLPAADGATFGSELFGRRVATHADATEIVSRFSFAEWVIARNQTERVPWTRLTLPPYRNGTPRRYIFWYSVLWLARNARRQWVLDVAQSRIQRGSISGAAARSAPVA
jgi:hypothetical protein